jgi:hypothetical protein
MHQVFLRSAYRHINPMLPGDSMMDTQKRASGCYHSTLNYEQNPDRRLTQVHGTWDLGPPPKRWSDCGDRHQLIYGRNFKAATSRGGKKILPNIKYQYTASSSSFLDGIEIMCHVQPPYPVLFSALTASIAHEAQFITLSLLQYQIDPDPNRKLH